MWKLKQAETEVIFILGRECRRELFLVREGSVGVEKVWKDLKECILEEAVVACGETRGIAK